MGLYTEMFLTFAKIGSFTIGGGYAMIQMMEREVVEKKRWLDHEEFMNTLVVAQSTPGLFAIDMASHIGLKLKGIKGGIVAAFHFFHFADSYIFPDIQGQCACGKNFHGHSSMCRSSNFGSMLQYGKESQDK